MKIKTILTSFLCATLCISLFTPYCQTIAQASAISQDGLSTNTATSVSLPQEEGIWHYSISADSVQTSPFVLSLTESMKGIKVQYIATAQTHTVLLSVKDAETDTVVYETTLSVLKDYEQELHLSYTLFDTQKEYRLVLSAPSISDAAGTIKCSANPTFFTDIDAEDATLYTATKQLHILGILNGYPDQTYLPDKPITRAEMAKIIVAFMNETATVDENSPYTDVDKTHPLYDYICTATRLALFCGHGDGTFAPEAGITYNEAFKLIVCALGYAPMAADMGVYPHGYLTTAADLGISSSLAITDTNAAATRGDIAILLYNALHKPLMEAASENDAVVYNVMNGKDGNPLKTIYNTKFAIFE